MKTLVLFLYLFSLLGILSFGILNQNRSIEDESRLKSIAITLLQDFAHGYDEVE